MILLVGAAGYTGRHVLPLLLEAGHRVRCLLRPSSDRCAVAGAEVVTADLERPEQVEAAFDEEVRQVVNLAHIRFGPVLSRCAGPQVEHGVMLSSLRLFSQVPDESVEVVRRAEASLLETAPGWTVLRPSMIYGPGDDRNLSRLAAYLRRRRFFPLFGGGTGLQQPVWVGDVARAVVAALGRREAVAGKSYALAGPAALPYRQLVDTVGAAVGCRPFKVRLPVAPVVGLLRLAAACGVRPGIDPGQVRRLQEDKVYDIGAARRDLDFAPLDLAEGLRRSMDI